MPTTATDAVASIANAKKINKVTKSKGRGCMRNGKHLNNFRGSILGDQGCDHVRKSCVLRLGSKRRWGQPFDYVYEKEEQND